jgi:hypothetical protein
MLFRVLLPFIMLQLFEILRCVPFPVNRTIEAGSNLNNKRLIFLVSIQKLGSERGNLTQGPSAVVLPRSQLTLSGFSVWLFCVQNNHSSHLSAPCALWHLVKGSAYDFSWIFSSVALCGGYSDSVPFTDEQQRPDNGTGCLWSQCQWVEEQCHVLALGPKHFTAVSPPVCI